MISRTSWPARACELPADSLLGAYRSAGAYTDCFAADLPGPVSHAQFVEAFYTTGLFKLERLLLGLFAARPSTDAQARQMADGRVSSFAAWTVEARADRQLLLAAGRTRSWLMVAAQGDAQAAGTRLYFGSAVVPRRAGGMGSGFSALLGLHKLYSRALLHCAAARLSRQGIGAQAARRGGA